MGLRCLVLLLLLLLPLLEGRRVSIVFAAVVFVVLALGLIAEGLGIADAFTAGTAGTATVDAAGLGAKEEEEVGGARLGTAAACKTFCVGIGSLVLREGGIVLREGGIEEVVGKDLTRGADAWCW